MPKLKGFAHIDLTVSDREGAAIWWQDVMGFTIVHRSRGDSFDCVSLVHPSGLVVSVVSHDEPVSGEFDERRVGLDHLSFEVADPQELRRWLTHLEAKGVAHSGIADMWYGPTLVFRGPDNIQLELIVTRPADELAELLTESRREDAVQPARSAATQTGNKTGG